MKSRILVIGADGMLGFALMHFFSEAGHRVTGTVRNARHQPKSLTAAGEIIAGIDIGDFTLVQSVVENCAPRYIFNCTVVKTATDAESQLQMLRVNAFFPRWLDGMARSVGAHFVHFSTDSIFDGTPHPHLESSAPDPLDFYAMSKCLGEVSGLAALTVRTSMIGRAKHGLNGLVDWALSSDTSTLEGYSGAIFSGLPVNRIGRYFVERIENEKQLPSGILHLPGPQISKFSLLRLILDSWGKIDVQLIENKCISIDRTLLSSRHKDQPDGGFESWPMLVEEMRAFYSRFGM
jgi:dTDP-4-dehydrorhamnose reductase